MTMPGGGTKGVQKAKFRNKGNYAGFQAGINGEKTGGKKGGGMLFTIYDLKAAPVLRTTWPGKEGMRSFRSRHNKAP